MVDTGLLIAIIWAIWQLAALANTIVDLSARIHKLEAQQLTPEAARRLAVLEATQTSHDRFLSQMRSEMLQRFDRLDDRLERIRQ